jgi:hypothetical protein
MPLAFLPSFLSSRSMRSALQEQLAALQDHHRQQTSTLLLKHKKELEDARAEAAESAKPHESNGFLSLEESAKNVEDAMYQAQNAEKGMRRAHEREEVSNRK